jgi:uncharacterized protein YciI
LNIVIFDEIQITVMKKIILFALSVLFSTYSFCQNNNSMYDQSLADSLGTDEYGMKNYVLVILKTGSNTTEKKETSDSLFAGHFANMGRLSKEGKLIVAGPIRKNDKNYRGIFILNVETIEEANALIQTDPTIKAKVLDAELFQWYGSAALPMHIAIHEKIQKTKM